MSVSRVVYFSLAKAPSPTEWDEAVRSAGFDMALETDFELDSLEGFLPVTFEGVEIGFEAYFEPVEELEPEDDVQRAIGDRDASLAFITHSDMRGLATAVIAAAVLASLTEGVVHDEESGELIAASDAIAAAKELIESIRSDL